MISQPAQIGVITPVNYFQSIKVDSFKLRVPIEDVSVISTTFRESFQKLYVTGEIDEHINLEQHKTDITDGITCRIGVVCCRVGQNQSKEFVYFQLNAKMLKEQYLEGITEKTIRKVYDYIMALKIVYVEYEVFLNSYVSDIDFAYDIEISPENMIILNQKIYSKVNEKKIKFVDKPFRKDSNIGIQFNRREKATPTNPFIKIYHKGVEFKHHSTEFSDKYLKGVSMENHGRLEYTLKNAKHQKHLGIQIKTLRQLITQDKMLIENIVLSAIPECYIDSKIVVKDYGKITPVNKMLIFYMEKLINQGFDKYEIFSVIKIFSGADASSRRDASRMKKLLNTLWDTIETGGKKQAKKNKELNDILRVLKIDL